VAAERTKADGLDEVERDGAEPGAADADAPGYVLDAQIGYALRLATQRHVALFQARAPEGLTPTQFSALIRLADVGPVSQNLLGRLAAIDAATTKGVIERLSQKGMVATEPDPADRRRSVVRLTEAGARLIPELRAAGAAITEATLAPLTPAERRRLLALLDKLA
jgi:DNA-binding MarR family transcriptional regulator